MKSKMKKIPRASDDFTQSLFKALTSCIASLFQYLLNIEILLDVFLLNQPLPIQSKNLQIILLIVWMGILHYFVHTRVWQSTSTLVFFSNKDWKSKHDQKSDLILCPWPACSQSSAMVKVYITSHLNALELFCPLNIRQRESKEKVSAPLASGVSNRFLYSACLPVWR